MNNKRIFFIVPIFLTVILACVVPGLPSASAPLPTPTVDAAAIESMVAGTVSAAIAQTQQSMPNASPAVVVVTASAASTSTATSAPTATITPESTATPTPTRNPSQSMLIRQADGSTLFTDELGYYEIKLPPGWLALRINEREYPDAFLLEEAANIHIQQALLGVQNEDPNVLRLYAIDPARVQNEFVSDMRFVLDENMDISLNTDEELQAIAGKISTSADVFRFEVTSVKIVKSAGGIDFGVIEAKSSYTGALGVDVPIYQKRVYFNVPLGTQSITLTTVDDLKGTLLPGFDAMLETVRVVVEE